MRHRSVKIGTFVLRETTVFRNTYETAAWYQNVEVQAGEYDAMLTVGSGSRWVVVALPGKVVGSYFGALWAGVPINGRGQDEDLGKDASHCLRIYDYMVATDVLNNMEASPWRLDLGKVTITGELAAETDRRGTATVKRVGKLAWLGDIPHDDILFARGVLAERARQTGEAVSDAEREARGLATARYAEDPYSGRRINGGVCRVETSPEPGGLSLCYASLYSVVDPTAEHGFTVRCAKGHSHPVREILLPVMGRECAPRD